MRSLRVALAALVMLVPAAAAQAATTSVAVVGSAIQIDGDGDRNDLDLFVSGADVFVDDRPGSMVAVAPCSISGTFVRCPSQPDGVVANLGAGDDQLDPRSGFNRVLTGNGGPGADVLRGGTLGDTLDGGADRDTVTYAGRGAGVTVTLDDTANDGGAGENDDVRAEVVVGTGLVDTLTGGPGADELQGAGGNDVLDGAAGDDVLIGGANADTLTGGADRDLASYADKGTAGVNVSLDGVANDGTANENDNALVEDVLGGAGPDTLSGAAGVANALDGGEGGDVADYSARMDGVSLTLNLTADDGAPAEGDDVRVEHLRGGGGADTLTGDGLDNVLRGGEGADLITGGDGIDRADYSERATALTVTLGAGADDGAAGEGDDVRTEQWDPLESTCRHASLSIL